MRLHDVLLRLVRWLPAAMGLTGLTWITLTRHHFPYRYHLANDSSTDYRNPYRNHLTDESSTYYRNHLANMSSTDYRSQYRNHLTNESSSTDYRNPYWNHPANESSTTHGTDAIWIHVITPTSNARLHQRADLTRLAQTLAHVKRLHWILVEDAHNISQQLTGLLQRSQVTRFTHLAVKSTVVIRNISKGMEQRNLGLDYLREREEEGVVYFADDDNSYDVRLFDDCIRRVKTVGVWPVGLVGGVRVEAPNVTDDGDQVNGWLVKYMPNRMFATDMAGFAVSMNLIRKYGQASFTSHTCTATLFETCFMEQLHIGLQDLQVVQ